MRVRHKKKLKRKQGQEKAKQQALPRFLQLAVTTKEMKGGRSLKGGTKRHKACSEEGYHSSIAVKGTIIARVICV